MGKYKSNIMGSLRMKPKIIDSITLEEPKEIRYCPKCKIEMKKEITLVKGFWIFVCPKCYYWERWSK